MALTSFQTYVTQFADPDRFVDVVLSGDHDERARRWQQLVDQCGGAKAAEVWVDGFACQGEQPSGTPGEHLPCDNDVEPGDVMCAPCREKDTKLQQLSDSMDQLDAERAECGPGCPDDCDGDGDTWHTPASETEQGTNGQRSTAELITNRTAAREVPTDPHALAGLLGKASNAETNALYAGLVARTDIDHETAGRIWQRALDIVVHDEDLNANMHYLSEALQGALSRVETARGALSGLVNLHHPDYAESPPGEDIQAFLADAARALRAAEALNPHPE